MSNNSSEIVDIGMLVKNLVGLRLNELSNDIFNVIDDIDSDVNTRLKISKKKYSKIIFYVESHCINLESQVKRVLNDMEVVL